jgi:16S rRNA processing protein RimM
LNNGEAAPFVFGRVSGFRGNKGEFTVRVVSGDAARWTHVRRVFLQGPGGATVRPGEVESARAYNDRLVLKIRGVDEAGAAEALKGFEVCASPDDVPGLPDGMHWIARLVGTQVRDGRGAALGRVADVIETGGTDLLSVVGDDGAEILIPLAEGIVTGIDESAGVVTVTLPEGLRELNTVKDTEPS